MKTTVNYFSRMLCVFLLSVGVALTSCEEEPQPIAVQSVSLDKTSIEITVGETLKLTATVAPDNADNPAVAWTSSDPGVASVQDGIVTAHKEGRAKITVRTNDGGKTATCDVTVIPKTYPVESVSLDKTSYEMAIGDEVTLTATVTPDNATNKSATWSSSDIAVATVDNGKVTAVSPGEATITVTTEDGGKTAICKVTVKADPVVFALDKVTAATASFSGHLNVPAGDLPYCQVTVYYSDAETFNMNDAQSISATTFDENQDFRIVLSNLKYGVKYHYCMVADVKQADKVYGNVNEFTTSDVTINIAYVSSTTSVASFSGMVTGLAQEDYDYIKVGLHYSDSQEKFEQGRGIKVEATDIPEDGALSFELKELKLDTKYYYSTYISATSTIYGDAQEFMVGENLSFDVSVDESSITACTAKINGKISGVSKEEIGGMEWGIQYSSSPTQFYDSDIILADEISEDGSFQIPILDLFWGKTYYYRYYAEQSNPYKIVYGEIKEFTTDVVTTSLVVSKYFDIAVFDFQFEGLSEIDKLYFDYFRFWGSYEKDYMPLLDSGVKVDDNYRISLKKEIGFGRIYYYNYSDGKASSEVFSFKMGENIDIQASVDETSITTSSAIVDGQITGWSSEFPVEVGVAYRPSYSAEYKYAKAIEVSTDGKFTCKLEGLSDACSYVYCPYHSAKPYHNKPYHYETKDFTTKDVYSESAKDLDIASATDLSVDGSANCYIISEKGLYKFKTVKGNSSEYLKDVASCKILWESYGTSASIQLYDLIKGVCYRDEYIAFQTADSFKEGNAVIAATDAAGNILWSWHIWMTDQPHGQVYYNDAGTMMDRNLGATTTVPGSAGALGLKYQWGRKDPFLDGAESTITWPTGESDETSLAFATANPTIEYGGYWKKEDGWISSKAKAITDPCPVGWRVPDGGQNGVWAKARGSKSIEYIYDNSNEGINFSGIFGPDQTIWYPKETYWATYDDSGKRAVFPLEIYDFDFYMTRSEWDSVLKSRRPVRCIKEE